MSQALYRKWRPQKWEDVSDQEHVTQTLRNAVVGGRLGHAYLFSGPRGTGKTSVARLLAKAANCLNETPSERPCNQCQHCLAVNKGSFLDMIEIDAASNNGVDDVRDLREKINFSPNQGKYKVYIIDEVHMLSTPAFNALLKTLEEPPSHAIFILATTEIHKIPATVLSRCQRHEFKRASIEAISRQLKDIATSEKIPADDEALTLIARQATGSFRDAISLLDQMASTGEKITLKKTHTILGTAASQNVLELVDAIQNGQSGDGLNQLHAALDVGTDPRVLARQIVEYLRALLLIKLGNPDQVNLPKETLKQAAKHASAFSTEQVLHMIREFNAAATDLRGGWQPALSLELALAGVMVPLEEKPAMQTLQATELKTELSPVKQAEAPIADRVEKAAIAQKKDNPKTTLSEEKKALKSASNEEKLDLIRKEWRNIKNILRQTNPKFSSGLDIIDAKINNNVLKLFYKSDEILKKFHSQEFLDVVQKIIRDLTQLDLQVSCFIRSADGNIDTEVKPDSILAAGLNLGGKITDIHD